MQKVDDFYAFRIKPLWKQFWQESFAFWMICGYLFFEYVRPQSIFPAINILPWTTLLIGLSAIGIFFDKNRKWVSDPANKWMIVLYALIIISTYSGYWPSISKLYLDQFYTWLVIYFLIINIVNTPQRFYIFILIFFIASFKLSLHGATVWAGRGFRFTDWGIMGPPGYFQNSGELSIQMLCFFPLGYYLYQALKNRVALWERGILALFFITPAMTILGASSRGSQIALAIQCLVMFYKQVFKIKVIIGISIFGFLALTLLPEEQKDRFRSIGDDRTSQQRLLYWENGIEMIKDHPFLGVGYFNFSPYFEAYYPEDMLYRRAEMPHNILIQIGTDIGLLGLSAYLLLLTRFWRKNRYEGPNEELYYAFTKGIRVGIVGFIVAGQFVTVAYYPYMWIGLALYVSLLNSYKSSAIPHSSVIPTTLRSFP